MTEITRPFAPAPDKSTKPATDYSKGKKTETYYFPRRVLLQLQNLERVMFEMGPQEVPEEILNHAPSMEWLRNNGAKPHVIERAAPQLEKLPEITEHHVRFLQQRGYPNVRTVADAIRFITEIDAKDKPGFFAEAADWKGPLPNDSLDPNATPAAIVAAQSETAADNSADNSSSAVDDAAGKVDGKPTDDAGKSDDKSGDKADDKADDKAISASAGSDGDDNSKAAAQGASTAKPAGDAGKPKGSRK